MCTIYTFTSELRPLFLPTIETDLLYNPDGGSVLVFDGKEYSLFRSSNNETFLTMLSVLEGDRFWVHLRMATTDSVGVTRCHGLDGGDWVVFHNGIINYEGDLDSRGIAELFAKHSEKTARLALRGESYANVMAINTAEHRYVINRSTTGTLFTDGNGNFSTTRILGVCETVVPVGQEERSFSSYRKPKYGWSNYTGGKYDAWRPYTAAEKQSNTMSEALHNADVQYMEDLRDALLKTTDSWATYHDAKALLLKRG